LQHAELVAVWISQDVPAPSGLADRLPRQEPGAKADEPVYLRLKVACAQVEMNPVLAALVLGDLLQENLGASAIGWQQALIATGGNAVAHITQDARPEFCGAGELGTVDHDNQFTPQVGMRLTHDLILHQRGAAERALICRDAGAVGVIWDRSERRVLEPVGEQCLLAEDFDGGMGGRQSACQDEQEAGCGPADRDVGFAVAVLDGDAGRCPCDQPLAGAW
jgi:hypothetical protein